MLTMHTLRARGDDVLYDVTGSSVRCSCDANAISTSSICRSHRRLKTATTTTAAASAIDDVFEDAVDALSLIHI